MEHEDNDKHRHKLRTLVIPSNLHLYLPGYFTRFGSRRGGGHFEAKKGHLIFTNNMIFLECGVIALFEAFYMLRDHNHVKMKF